MARHRSPQGRRTHLGLPLPPFAAAAGAVGVGARIPTPETSIAPRVIATVFAGGVLAAAGQAALAHSLPLAADGGDVLRVGVQQLIDAPSVPAPPATAVAPEPRPVDVAGLVSSAHRQAAASQAAAARAAASQAAATQVAQAAPKIDVPAVPRPRPAPAADPGPVSGPAAGAQGDVQMVVGRVTSGFGFRWGRLHKGLDVAAPIGTPIHAPMAGEVVASGPATGFGLWVRVRHDDGTITTYGHVNRTLVHVGQHVAAGQEIAEVGNRGDSTGPHLHVEVQTPAGATVNPRPWLDGHGIAY